ncbi:MAG: DNA translocase FtsK [Sphingobacteriales bacterium]|nr:DNA translocase FtsK [Sphingobacteriales bacterium]
MSRKKTTNTRSSSSNSNILENFFRSIAQSIFNFVRFFTEPNNGWILGLLCWIAAIFLLFAFLSYGYSSWGIDQSYVKDATLFNILTDNNVQTNNMMGRLGSYVSNLFFFRWFGWASFVVVLLLILTGDKLIRKRQSYSLSRLYRYGFISLFLFATLFSFLFSGNSGFPHGGGIGDYFNNWLQSFAGGFGSFLVLMFCFALWLKFVFDIQLDELFKGNFSFDNITEPFRKSWQQLRTSDSNTSNNRTTSTQNNNANNNTNTARKMPPPAISNMETSAEKNYEEERNVPPGQQVPLSFGAKITLPNTDVPPKRKPPIVDNHSLILKDSTEEYVSPISKDDDDEQYSENVANANPREDYDPTLELVRYKKPVLDLLDLYGRDLYENNVIQVNMDELEQNKAQIVETLRNYAIEISSISATPGPTVTLYEIVPAAGVRISRIKNLEDDIALSLAALGIRIIAPMPGKGTIGIEVPNQKKEIVSLRSILQSDKFQRAKMELPIGLGKTISDEPFVADLAKMPHLLLAGATGQGKSVCLNVILVSLLFKKHPSELKFVLIDPKKVELSLFNIIERHFLAKLPDEEEAIVTDTKKVINTLNALCIEMDARYDLLKRAYVRNLREYNNKFKKRQLNPEKGHRYLPYLVLVIDEFADLIMTAGKEVEMPIARLAQLARAVGLHLVIATQRPTVNIITGTIKANFPVRIAFRVTAKVDSRTILDQGGANQLIGSGDMLLSMSGDIVRLQCAFVDTPEVERVAEFIGEQMGFPEPFLLPEFKDDENPGPDGFDPKTMELDELFEEAARIIVQHQQGSTSLIQRRMKLGYNRAGRLMDQLEAMSIVGPNLGSKAREVLVLDEFELDNFLERIKQRRAG